MDICNLSGGDDLATGRTLARDLKNTQLSLF